VQNRQRLIKIGLLAIVMMLVGVDFVVAGNPAAKEAEAEMEWGYKAARRGYWQEALLRFEHANQLTPDQPRIINNIAVAQEANGLFEQALLSYQLGLAISPKDNALRRNYMRFQEFYANYVAVPDDIEEATEEKDVSNAQNN